MYQVRELRKLNAIYSTSVLKELGSKGYSKKIVALLNETNLIGKFAHHNLTFFFEKIFDALLENYRSEYIYKSAIINKILFGRHSINTASMFTEFAVNGSIADVAFFNGTSTVYEIKTEFDDFKRLESQLSSYKRVFEKIFIVTYEQCVTSLLKQLDDNIGIIVLTPNYSLRTIRESHSNFQQLDSSSIFKCFRKTEYLTVIKKYYGHIPEVPNTQIYKLSLELVKKINPLDLHNDFVEILKQRNKSEKFKNFITFLPRSLKALGSTTEFTNVEKDNIIRSLNNTVIYIN